MKCTVFLIAMILKKKKKRKERKHKTTDYAHMACTYDWQPPIGRYPKEKKPKYS